MNNENPCPACASNLKFLCGTKNGLDVFICRNCKTLFSVNEPGQSFDYDNYYHSDNLITSEFINHRLDEIISSFELYRLKNRFLDVGCGAGNLLAAAKRNKWDAEGVEVSKASIDYLQKQNFQVFHGELSAANFPENSFDVVTAIEILEHIAEPLKLLEEIIKILRPGGLFFATTPHGAGVSAKVLRSEWSCVAPPEHLHLFSVKGMEKLLKKVGFKQLQIVAQGTNPFEIIHAVINKSELTKQKSNNEKVFNRIETSYKLNQMLSSSPSRKLVKSFLNSLLNATKMGDSLKIRAIK